ncbi:MAG: hypothetical protein ACI4KL_00925 [Lentihominibacter sp.]
MKRRIAGVLTAGLLLAATAVFATDALPFTGEQVFRNEVETSGVDVRIEQYRETREGITKAEGTVPVIPGETVSCMPKVTNLKEDSYVRVKFEFSGEYGEKTAAGDSCIKELNPGWVRRGDYYYFTGIMSKAEEEYVFRSMVIPDEISRPGEQLKLCGTVDGIQAVNFTPDFDSNHPWGSVEIQQVRNENSDTAAVRTARSVSSPDFTYAREGIFECSTEDLFSNFGRFRPGDSCSETLTMKNDSQVKMGVYFRTENFDSELLREMELSISLGGNHVYSGNLASPELESFMKIGTIASGKAGELKFEIRMPESADNRYSLLKENVTWIIAVREGEKTADEDNTSGNSGVKTGDTLMPVIIAALTAAAALAISAAVITSGRRKKNGS